MQGASIGLQRMLDLYFSEKVQPVSMKWRQSDPARKEAEGDHAGGRQILTIFANGLVATRQAVGIDREPAANCATKLDRDLILGQRAVIMLADILTGISGSATDLISSA